MVQWPHNVKYCICCSARVTIQRLSVISSKCVSVCVWVCFNCELSQRGFGVGHLKQEENHHRLRFSSVVFASWPEENKPLEWHCDEVLFCVGIYVWPLKTCLLYPVTGCYRILCLPPHISGEESPSSKLSLSESQGTYTVLLTLSQFQ